LFITRTLGVLTIILTWIGALAGPAVASAAGLVVTDPGTLVTLGIALLSTGLGTRKLFRRRKDKS
jgi:hypothetical protein